MKENWDTINSAMNLAAGSLAFVGALIAILPRKTVRKLGSNIITLWPAVAWLFGVVAIVLNWWNVAVVVIGAGLVGMSLQFLRRPEPITRGEVLTLVAEWCLFTLTTLLTIAARIIYVLERLVQK